MNENEIPPPSIEISGEPAATVDWRTSLEPNVTQQELIARGGYGEVYKIFARKIMRLFGTVTKQDVENEAEAVERLRKSGRHPNIVEIFHDGWLPPLDSPSFYIFDMEYCKHDLEYHLNKMVQEEEKTAHLGNGKLVSPERIQKALRIASDITDGIEFIHRNRQTHRDLKPKNVLCSSNCERWKIADFGISVEVTSKRLRETRYSRGTTPYRAPEISEFPPRYNNRVDIWALGCIVYEAFTGSKAFETDRDVYRYCDNPSGHKISFERLHPPLRSTLQKPIENMLSLDARVRPSAESLIGLWKNVPTPAVSCPDDAPLGGMYVLSKDPAPRIFSPPGALKDVPSTCIKFVAVNICNTRVAMIFASDESSPVEYIQVRAPTDPNIFWEQRRLAQHGPTLLTFTERGKFLVFRDRNSPPSVKVLDIEKLQTFAIIWVEEVPVAISFSDFGHRAAIAVRGDGHEPRLRGHTLFNQSEASPTVFVSGDVLEVDLSGQRGNPEIFYSAEGQNLVLTQWCFKDGITGDLEITIWDVDTRACVNRTVLQTALGCWPNKPLRHVAQNHLLVYGNIAFQDCFEGWHMVQLAPEMRTELLKSPRKACSWIVTVPAGFLFIEGRKMELWTPAGGIASLGELDSEIDDKTLALTLSDDQRTLMAIMKEGDLKIWNLK